jgi:hypothetical protein
MENGFLTAANISILPNQQFKAKLTSVLNRAKQEAHKVPAIIYLGSISELGEIDLTYHHELEKVSKRKLESLDAILKRLESMIQQ